MNRAACPIDVAEWLMKTEKNLTIIVSHDDEQRKQYIASGLLGGALGRCFPEVVQVVKGFAISSLSSSFDGMPTIGWWILPASRPISR